MRPVEVAIVGAGAAGLAAARELRKRGRSVLVLEARDRIGGRAMTLHDPAIPLPIELGAEFIHGHAPVTEGLLTQAGLSAIDVGGPHRIADRGRLRPVREVAAIDQVLRRIDTEGPDRSIADFLARRPGGAALARQRTLTRRFIEGFHAADIEQMSAQSIASEPGESPTESASRIGRPTQGYGALMQWLAADSGATIQPQSEVRSIDWREGRAVLEVRSGSSQRARRISARAVIVTVPVGVLAAATDARGALAFDPPLPRIACALAGIGVGSVARLVVWFRELPWDGDPGHPSFDFLHLPGDPFQVLWTAHPVRWPLAVIWCGGPNATRLLQGTRSEVERSMHRQLAAALRTTPARVQQSVRRVWWHDWDHDPYARGAYTYARVGGSDAYATLARSERGTIFFAGEATDAEGGTVEAALRSGIRAARQVARALSGG